MRVSASMKSICQGQRAGRCSVQTRAVWVRRPGRVNRRVRSVRAVRGVVRFVHELVPRVRRAGATGPILLRADSGFWNKKVIAYLRAHGALFSIAVPMHQAITAQIALISHDAWTLVENYPDSGVCEVAETTLGDERLIV